MGGGDLNLKKSWDPRRLDNQEKKWKLEEIDKKERKRLAELKEERQEERAVEEMRRRGEDAGVIEKRKDRLDWMYKGPGGHVNPDDYLLGKEIDKVIVDKQSGKTQSNGAPDRGSIAVLGSSASPAIDAKDMARKMREDPLFAIKKRELNNRKELVSNPIRMKQLQQLLHSQVGSDKKKSKKVKKHKEKKRKKHKRSQETDSDSESESDDDPAPRHSNRRVQNPGVSSDRHKGKHHMRGHTRKHSSSGSDSNRGHGRGKEQTLASLNKSRMKELLEREILKKHRGKKARSESSSSESDSEDQKSHMQRKRHKSTEKMKTSHSVERGREHISSPPDSRRQRRDEEKIPPGYGLQRGARSQRRSPPPSQAISPPKYQSDNRDKYSSRNHDRSPHSRTKHPEKRRNRYEGDRSPSPLSKGERYRNSNNRADKRRGRSRSRSPLKHHGRSADKLPRSKSPQKKNSQKDMAPKRKLTAEEMERKRAEMMTNAKWRDDQRKSRVMTYEKEERAEIEMEKKKSKNAEFAQPLKLPENSSVEDRIHRNIYNIQRTKAALDKNFAKR